MLFREEREEFATKEEFKECTVCGVKFVPIVNENYCSGLCKDEITGMIK